MAGLKSIVRVLTRVMERVRHELIDDGEERPASIGDHVGGLPVVIQRGREEPSRNLRMAARGSVALAHGRGGR
jgi:hypothetical protein